MRLTWDDLNDLSDTYGMDIDAILEILGDPDIDSEGNEFWEVADENGDKIPDALADLITNPITTETSQGGILG